MLITVDTGGTKTLVAAFSSEGKIIASHKFPTPRQTQAYILQLTSVIKEVAGDKKIDAIVVAVPGLVEKNIVKICPNLGWKDYDLIKDLKHSFKNIPILLENDANLGGLGEARMLDDSTESVLYVTISTGIGVGYIRNGQIDPALNSCEGGHIMLEYDGVVKDWESFASGRAIYETYRKYAKDITSKRVWLQISHRISRGFFALIPVINPDIIIIGGSMGTHIDKFGDALTEILDERMPAIIRRPKIVKAAHPEQAVIYGCYFYAIDNLSSKTTKA